MNSPTLNPVFVPGNEDEAPAPSLPSVVGKSVLLNLVIVLTSCPVLIFAGGPKAVVPTLEIMAGISVLIWTATFAVFSFVSIARICWTPISTLKRIDPPSSQNGAGVADHCLDGSV
jgi:hypothetical protein